LVDRGSVNRNKACSKACLGILTRGTNNPQWKGGRSPRYYRKHLKDACERCGTTSRLVIHHRDTDRSNNEPGNLETLCRRCHQIHHKCSTNFKAAKLDESQVRDIRYLFDRGLATRLALANRFGVTRGNIDHIVRRKTWQHVSDHESSIDN
jgi:hypothetical protein